MSNKKRMCTVTGKVATRRVRSILPIKLTTDPDGVRRLGVYVVATLDREGLQLAYVGAQLMRDTRGNHVLPHSQFVHKDKHRIIIYHVHAAIGELQTVAESVIRQLNERLTGLNNWHTPAGLMLGKLKDSPMSDGINAMQAQGRAHRLTSEKPVFGGNEHREVEKLVRNGVNAGNQP